jgi:hypothetical protein
MYRHFCISVTTKMNPNRHMKNIINCGRQKLSDSYTKYYSPNKYLTFEIIVLCKGKHFQTIYTEESKKVCYNFLQ